MRKLKILMLEDNAFDAQLIKEELIVNEFSFTSQLVETKKDFTAAIHDFKPDLILSDYTLPQFTGFEALKIAVKLIPDIPFIIVTGSLTEEIAVDSIKLGAWDYVIKENLVRLSSAITNALKLKVEKDNFRKASDALQKSKGQYRLITENVSDLITLHSFNTKISYKYISPSIKKMCGYEPQELLGKSPWEFIHPDDKKYIFPLLMKYIGMKVKNLIIGNELSFSETVELRFKHKAGHWIELQCNGNILNGQLLFASRDITVRKRNERELIKRAAALQQSPSVIVITDLEGKIEYVNPKFEKITGYTIKEVLGQSSNLLKSGEQPVDSYKKLWEVIISGKEWRGEFHNKKKNGELFWEAASISAIFDTQGKIINYLKVAEDITERKQAEDDLKVALVKATESDRLKSAFLATMSHELRTPLNTIIGFSDMVDGSLPIEDIVSFCKMINSSGNHLLSIIDDLLDITLIESDEINIVKQDFKLVTILNDIHKIIKFEQKRISKENLELNQKISQEDKNLIINTDLTKLKQILINLLKNALKFTNEGHINYGFNIEANHGKPMLKFYVEDTGIGIPKDKQEFIFDIFRQVDDSHTRQHEGVGIGLSVAKKLTELLGGKLWLESTGAKGSAFCFTLPYNAIDQIVIKHKDEIIKEKYNALRVKNILIVEDDETSFEYLKIVLNKFGINTIWAKNGVESIQHCKENPHIDLVLMDINMPEMNGYEAAKEIKKIHPELPIVVQTAYAIAGDSEKAIAAGCDDYISKPIKQEVLIEKIVKLIV